MDAGSVLDEMERAGEEAVGVAAAAVALVDSVLAELGALEEISDHLMRGRGAEDAEVAAYFEDLAASVGQILEAAREVQRVAAVPRPGVG